MKKFFTDLLNKIKYVFTPISKETKKEIKEIRIKEKTTKNLAKTRLNLIIKEIKESSKGNLEALNFDIKGFKNVIHNTKVSSNNFYFEHFIKEDFNRLGLSSSLVISHDLKINLKEELISKLSEFNNSNLSKFKAYFEMIKINKLINKSINYLLEDYKTKSNFFIIKNIFKKDGSEVIKSYFNEVKEYSLIYIKNDNFKLDKDLELTITNINNLINDASIKLKEYPYHFKETKVYLSLVNSFNKKFKKLKPIVTKEVTRFYDLFKKENFNRETIKTYLFGSEERRGILTNIVVYALLILFGFVYLYPMLYMLSYSFMSSSDLVNPNVTYIPTHLEGQNYIDAFTVLNYWSTLGESLLVSILPAICQTICCSLVAYGLARYDFKGKKVLFGLIIFTFLIPSCLTMLPTISLYASMGITGNVLSYILPALFGQGLKSAVFILIFYQYFKGIPQSITEAAEIDGANTFVVFLRIAIPSAKSGILLSILLSVVWYYNETVLASAFFGSEISTLPLALENFKSSFDNIYQDAANGKSINEAIYMAGTMLNILPLLILYFFTQKYFVQGVDKAGITGE